MTGNVLQWTEKEEAVKFCQRQGLNYRPILSYSRPAFSHLDGLFSGQLELSHEKPSKHTKGQSWSDSDSAAL